MHNVRSSFQVRAHCCAAFRRFFSGTGRCDGVLLALLEESEVEDPLDRALEPVEVSLIRTREDDNGFRVFRKGKTDCSIRAQVVNIINLNVY